MGKEQSPGKDPRATMRAAMEAYLKAASLHYKTPEAEIVLQEEDQNVHIQTVNGESKEVHLEQTEMVILGVLMQNPLGVFDDDAFAMARAQKGGRWSDYWLDEKSYISHLRKKLSPDVLIHTILGKGYTLTSNDAYIYSFCANEAVLRGEEALPPRAYRHATPQGDLFLFEDRNIAISPFVPAPYVSLTPRETLYLQLLMSHPRRKYTSNMLAQAAIETGYHIHHEDADAGVKTIISTLRAKLENRSRGEPSDPSRRLIHTIGDTYSLTPAVPSRSFPAHGDILAPSR